MSRHEFLIHSESLALVAGYRMPHPPGMMRVSIWRTELSKHAAVIRNPDSELNDLAPKAAIVTL
jgi:hypothetical protein